MTSLSSYRLLGRAGLRVSPIALGTMTFGTNWQWGADRDEARKIFDEYVGRGGNFIDTSNNYTSGAAERLVGEFAGERRNRLVVATKYTLPTAADDPNSGGNHRKSMICSVESSLRRLRTDYLDLLYLHAWDTTTEPQEILRAMDDLVSAGKVLYLGISNTAAWQISRMQAIAELRGLSPLVALQIEYNLTQRIAERDLIPMACEMGLGVIAYSPLADGILAGKYSRKDLCSQDPSMPTDGTRRKLVLAGGALTERALAITDTVKAIAEEMGKRPSQVALSWLLSRHRITAPIFGARTLEQFRENLRAFDVHLTDEHLARLEEISAIEPGYPHDYLAWLIRSGHMSCAMDIVGRSC